VLSSGERTIAEQGRGVVWIRLPFGPASQVKSRDVRRYAMMFGLSPIELLTLTIEESDEVLSYKELAALSPSFLRECAEEIKTAG
jgi:hypothetical protein